MKNSVVYLLLGYVLFSSCGDVKKLQYLQGPIDTAKYAKINYQEPVIQVGDALSITVFSANAMASAQYNLPSSAAANSIGTSGTAPSMNAVPANGSVYVVDNNGKIYFQGLGLLQAKGLMRQQLAGIIADSLKRVLKDVHCDVKFSNFKITVLGEVGHPAIFAVPNEKVSILEAIGLAGDLNAFARRDSIMIIRETDVERKFGWVDLRKPDIFASEFFYLQQNDVVVVHPTRNKAASNDQVLVRNISLGATLLSTLAVVYSLLTR